MDIQAARHTRDRIRGRQRRHPLALQSGTRKHREIRLAPACAHQIGEVRLLLSRLPGLEVDEGLLPHSVSIWYEVTDHTLEGLEQALVARGLVLDASLYCRFIRWVVYYSEATQRRNLHQPERLIKKYNETYSKAWERHRHGDHDDTPPDLRQDH
jgi:hypothetical protein